MSKAGFHAASFKIQPWGHGLDHTASTLASDNASNIRGILSPAGSVAFGSGSPGSDQSNAANNAGTQSSPSVYLRNHKARSPYVREIETKMASYDAANYNPPTAKRSHAKLHKRGGSDSSVSLPGPPSALRGSVDTFSTPFATYEEPSHHASRTPSGNSTPKLKPYLRKMSATAKEDQGKLDLSRSVAENDRLAGLGIQEFGSRSAADVAFSHSNRRTTSHSRTISGGSQVSNGSGSNRPSQPFVHPMRQTPRPYTPPAGRSYASSFNDDEANESSDIVDDEFKLGHGFRTRRSMSISSTPQIPPTPLSQSHTASDLGLVPKLTSGSQTNLSIKSSKSGKSSRSKLGRSRRDTSRSQEHPTSPSTRTSFDVAMSFVSRKSDLEPQSREDRIRAARLKFEEKEASKERKARKETTKRQDTERTKHTQKEERQPSRPDAAERPQPKLPSSASETRRGKRKDSKRDSMNEKLDARPYEGYRESNEASLPIQGRRAGASEKAPRGHAYHVKPAQSGWVRFEAWFRTRMLSCGEGRE